MSVQSSPLAATMKEVARLNNEGVRSLALCNAAMAHQCFSSALAMVNTQLLADSVDFTSSDAVLAIPQLASMAVPSLEDETFYIHNRALAFNEGLVGSADDLSLASSMILFNLALTYHARGIAKTENTVLYRACRLYDMCAALLVQGEASTLELQSVASALLIACGNNLAQIHHCFLSNSDKAVDILNDMHISPEFVHTAFMTPCHLDEIMLNVCAATVAPKTAAPAA